MINIFDWCKEQKEPIDCLDKSTGLVFMASDKIRSSLRCEKNSKAIKVYDSNTDDFMGFALPMDQVDPEPITYVPMITSLLE